MIDDVIDDAIAPRAVIVHIDTTYHRVMDGLIDRDALRVRLQARNTDLDVDDFLQILSLATVRTDTLTAGEREAFRRIGADMEELDRDAVPRAQRVIAAHDAQARREAETRSYTTRQAA